MPRIRAGESPDGITAIILNRNGEIAGVVHIDPDDPPTVDNDPVKALAKLGGKAFHEPGGIQVIVPRADYQAAMQKTMPDERDLEVIKAAKVEIDKGLYSTHRDAPASEDITVKTALKIAALELKVAAEKAEAVVADAEAEMLAP